MVENNNQQAPIAIAMPSAMALPMGPTEASMEGETIAANGHGQETQ